MAQSTVDWKHFERLRHWLELEAAAERERFQESLEGGGSESSRKGVSLKSLEIVDEAGALGGRHVLMLKKKGRGALPWTTLDAGSPVFLSAEDHPKIMARGVVTERSESLIHVVFDEPPFELDDQGLLRLDLAFDETTRKREKHALDKAAKAEKNRLAELRVVLLGQAAPRFDRKDDGLSFLNDSLNDVQREAIRFALSARDVAIIHGPPGTGKTTTLVEIIRQAVRRGEKVLVAAPSNLGVDNVLQKLIGFGEKAVRIGHPARVMPLLQAHTLDAQVEKHEDARLARKMQKEASQLFREAHRYTRSAPPKGFKRNLFQEARSLVADARQLESRAIERVLDSATIVCGTLSGVDSFVMSKRTFDLVVIDEAGQSTEPGTWIPLLKANRLILGGDHQQLPPTLLSPEALAGGYGKSLMERLVALYGGEITRRLDVQYRMHRDIMKFSSEEFYSGSLLADPSVALHQLDDLGLNQGTALRGPVHFIDTAGAGFEESVESESGSRFNKREAALIIRQAESLLASGLDPGALAIVAPYSAQVRYLREYLVDPRLEIDTIDGFQGREKEAILISLVRSNDEQAIGFLKETRRLNVAMTRARRHLFMVGDSATLSSHPFFQTFITSMENLGAYHSIWETAPELIGVEDL